jgi:hypothetical protein
MNSKQNNNNSTPIDIKPNKEEYHRKPDVTEIIREEIALVTTCNSICPAKIFANNRIAKLRDLNI